jgi:glycosyltransferase involved in cell wall biosynthesis
VFVFPTLGDSLPIVIMEAMASSLPVITTNVGAIREEVDDGVTGFLIVPDDTGALIERTMRLVRDPALREKMGGEGRRVADCRFNAWRNYNALLNVIKRSVSRS